MQDADKGSHRIIERLKLAIESASAHNPNDAERPAVILWMDSGSHWRPIIPQLRRLMPQLLTLGDFQPEERTGRPSGWVTKSTGSLPPSTRRSSTCPASAAKPSARRRPALST